MDEDTLIAEVFAPLATADGADALGDDAATIAASSSDIVITCDALAANVHFLPDDPPEAVAAKALRVNLSDLAAKGAEPVGYLLALALAPGWTVDWARRFAEGLRADNARYGVALYGGDTLRASPGGGTTIAVTAFGRTAPGATVRRRTAQPGDTIVITGTIGDAALGLRAHGERFGPLPALTSSDREALTRAYLWPEPPVPAWSAVRRFASASMDVSDGLLTDLAKLCRVAGVSARVELDAIRYSRAVSAAIAMEPALRDLALTGGDDYQILATVPAGTVRDYLSALRDLGITAAAIGEIGEGPPQIRAFSNGAAVTVADGRFAHF